MDFETSKTRRVDYLGHGKRAKMFKRQAIGGTFVSLVLLEMYVAYLAVNVDPRNAFLFILFPCGYFLASAMIGEMLLGLSNFLSDRYDE